MRTQLSYDQRPPEELKVQLEEIKVRQYIGPIAPPMPLPKSRGRARILARLHGVTVWAFFEQVPPAGAVPVGRENTRWTGQLLFLDPEGDLWAVPTAWYNLMWSDRVDDIEEGVLRAKEHAHQATEALRRLKIKASPTTEEQREMRTLEWEIKSANENARYGTARAQYIRRHARLDGCPHLNPIPDDSPPENS